MSNASNGTGLREHVFLFRRFLRSPRTVGALTASSRALAVAMVEGLALEQPGHVVELGPGTGVFTAAIAERLGKDTRFLAVDMPEGEGHAPFDPRRVPQSGGAGSRLLAGSIVKHA